MADSPTTRTLKLLRDNGYLCGITEKWNQFSKQKQDLFQFIDLVAICPNQIIGVQCTSATNRAARREKIQSLDSAKAWESAGGVIWLITWLKSAKTKRWIVTVEEISVLKEVNTIVEME